VKVAAELPAPARAAVPVARSPAAGSMSFAAALDALSAASAAPFCETGPFGRSAPLAAPASAPAQLAEPTPPSISARHEDDDGHASRFPAYAKPPFAEGAHGGREAQMPVGAAIAGQCPSAVAEASSPIQANAHSAQRHRDAAATARKTPPPTTFSNTLVTPRAAPVVIVAAPGAVAIFARLPAMHDSAQLRSQVETLLSLHGLAGTLRVNGRALELQKGGSHV
jgi:hypothetical protein